MWTRGQHNLQLQIAVMSRSICLLAVSANVAAALPKVAKPNFVWLHVESTDGRTYQESMKDIVPIPRIRSLMQKGVNFVNAYANVPICCPSRASVWAGREGHNMKHTRKDNGLVVNGAWNNNEGFGFEGDEFDTKKISDRLAQQANYTLKILGKEDWLTGGHSLNTMIDSFSIYSRWPYNIPEEGGFHIWGDCGGNVTINPGNATAHGGDWSGVEKGVEWLTDASSTGAAAQQPFFFYQGMVIVHPPYATDAEHIARIPEASIVAPEWPTMDDERIHACDLQFSMKKGCARTSTLAYLNTSAHKVGIRRAYYAMIAEFDDMVGEYIDAVALSPDVERNTVFIVSSDHGDMQMEHLQFYKMTAFEGSTRVPIVIAGAGVNHVGDGNVQTLVTLADLMPTMLDLAGLVVPRRHADAPEDPLAIDGYSLLPLLTEGDTPAAAATHRDFVISQFHGENAAMSWFMLRRGDMKYIAWGTGAEHVPQLFNLTSDPNEWHNLALHPSAKWSALVAELDALLKTAIDYPEVARDVARYNIQMARWWTQSEPHWEGVLNGSQIASHTQPGNKPCTPEKIQAGACTIGEGKDPTSWSDLWKEHPAWYQRAWDRWINTSIATAPDSVLIPKCPDGKERLVHGWHD